MFSPPLFGPDWSSSLALLPHPRYPPHSLHALSMHASLLSLPALLLTLPVVLAGFSQGTVNLTRDYAIEVSSQPIGLLRVNADDSWDLVYWIRQHGGLLYRVP